MRIVCAPDSFKGSLDAADAAEAMAAGIRAAFPSADVECCPVGDGGEGTLSALSGALDGDLVNSEIVDALFVPREAAWGKFTDHGFAYVEAAAAIGLDPDPSKRDVMSASSFGVGQLMMAASTECDGRLLIGLGGSATNDGGCGMAQAIGVDFFDDSGKLLEAGLSGGDLKKIDRIDVSDIFPMLSAADIRVLCDVNNPLTGHEGAASVYAPQKGASPSEVEVLDAGLKHLAAVIRRDIGIDIEDMPGAGAAGGLGAGMVAFAGGSLVSGIDSVLETLHFERRLAGASLCLTGEGRIDGQSLSGKACMGVAAVATRYDVPTVALVGEVGPGADRCIAAGLKDIIVIGEGHPAAYSISSAAPLLSAAAARVAKQYAENGDTIDG